MRAHVLQHVPFEGLGAIAPWLETQGAEVSFVGPHADPRMPRVEDLDWLIVMGGPMGANDDERHPWLPVEAELIAGAVEADKTVLGICLGAQLLARALGARVHPNREREIGWFPVEPVGALADASRPAQLAAPLDAFHWHGDTFDLPRGATHLARTDACEHQAFSVGPGVLGLQFHLEMTEAGARALVEQCPDDLRPGRWVQAADEMLRDPARFERSHAAMWEVLDGLARAGV